MPLPAWCELCMALIPYKHQAKTHFEGSKHREKCAQAGDKLVSKAIQARKEVAGYSRDHKVTFAAPSDPHRSSGPRSSASSKPATVEMACAGAGCNGRVVYPAGDQRAVGRCGACGFKQNPPTPVKPARN